MLGVGMSNEANNGTLSQVTRTQCRLVYRVAANPKNATQWGTKRSTISKTQHGTDLLQLTLGHLTLLHCNTVTLPPLLQTRGYAMNNDSMLKEKIILEEVNDQIGFGLVDA